jgi:hypothetical protein
MNRWAKVALLLGTFIQVPGIVYFLSVDETPVFLASVFVCLALGIWLFYFWDIRRNERVPRETERDWWWAMFLAPYIAEPFYFFRFIWKDEPQRQAGVG